MNLNWRGDGHIREYCDEQLFRGARLFIIYEGMTRIQQIIISKIMVKDAREIIDL